MFDHAIAFSKCTKARRSTRAKPSHTQGLGLCHEKVVWDRGKPSSTRDQEIKVKAEEKKKVREIEVWESV